MKTIYTASVTSVGGRNGHAESSDGVLKLDLAFPSPTGETNGKTNPEQLFAAGYAACFAGAMDHVARLSKQSPGEITIQSKVTLGQNDMEAFTIGVNFDITAPNLEQAAAEKLVEEAHKVCPYSNATRGNVEVVFSVHGGKS